MLDNSFKIHHLSFGNKAEFESIKSSYPDVEVIHPLDGFERKKEIS